MLAKSFSLSETLRQRLRWSGGPKVNLRIGSRFCGQPPGIPPLTHPPTNRLALYFFFSPPSFSPSVFLKFPPTLLNYFSPPLHVTSYCRFFHPLPPRSVIWSAGKLLPTCCLRSRNYHLPSPTHRSYYSSSSTRQSSATRRTLHRRPDGAVPRPRLSLVTSPGLVAWLTRQGWMNQLVADRITTTCLSPRLSSTRSRANILPVAPDEHWNHESKR